MSQIWTEKYRPKKLKNIKCNGKELELITLLVRSKRPLPHLLFFGPEGIGKTTIATCIAREKLGENWRENTKMMNASLNRGIDTVRQEIESFGKQKTMGDAPFKILILDEYDNATSANQHALRKVMEDFAKNNRFILCCNYEAKIIDPIKSRCAIYKIRPLTENQIADRLQFIIRKEEVNITEGAVQAIARASRGRMRNAINTLAKYSVLPDKIKISDVVKEIHHPGIKTILRVLLKDHNLNQGLVDAMGLFSDEGFTEQELISSVLNTAMSSKMPSGFKARVSIICAESSYQIAVGAPPEVQIYGFLAKLYELGLKLKKVKK